MGEDSSFCRRTMEFCSEEREMMSKYRAGEKEYTTCRYLPHAACFRYWHRFEESELQRCSISMAGCIVQTELAKESPDKYKVLEECRMRG